jgi:hypothetical protein
LWSIHDIHLIGCSSHSSIYGADMPWITMPSVTCQAQILTVPAFRGRVGILSSMDEGRTTLLGLLIGTSLGDEVDRCGLVAPPSWPVD